MRYSERFNYFSPQISMPCIWMEESERFNYFSKQLSMPCIFLVDTWQNYLFLPTINNALYIPRRYVTVIIISPTNMYALYIRGG